MTVLRRALTVAVLAVFTGLGGAGTALAHNTLVDSDPRDGARVETGPRQVRLTFDQPARAGYNTVNVVGPDGSHWSDGAVRTEGNDIIAPVRELGPAGTYTVGYRVLSDDGHPVTGKVTFELTQQQGGTPAPAPNDAGKQEPGSSGPPVWPWIIGVGVLVLIGAALALRLGRSKS